MVSEITDARQAAGEVLIQEITRAFEQVIRITSLYIRMEYLLLPSFGCSNTPLC